jgi:hypothetical protein
MTDKLEWDFDNPAHRRPRIEIVEREPPRYHHVELTIKHHRRAPPRFLPIFVAIVAVLLLWRYPFGFLMLGALAGSQTVSMFLFAAVILALLAWRDSIGARSRSVANTARSSPTASSMRCKCA